MEYEPDALSEYADDSVSTSAYKAVPDESRHRSLMRGDRGDAIAAPLLQRPDVKKCCGCVISPKKWCLYVFLCVVFIVALVLVFMWQQGYFKDVNGAALPKCTETECTEINTGFVFQRYYKPTGDKGVTQELIGLCLYFKKYIHGVNQKKYVVGLYVDQGARAALTPFVEPKAKIAFPAMGHEIENVITSGNFSTTLVYEVASVLPTNLLVDKWQHDLLKVLRTETHKVPGSVAADVNDFVTFIQKAPLDGNSNGGTKLTFSWFSSLAAALQRNETLPAPVWQGANRNMTSDVVTLTSLPVGATTNVAVSGALGWGLTLNELQQRQKGLVNLVSQFVTGKKEKEIEKKD
jgi:hypothetical protein